MLQHRTYVKGHLSICCMPIVSAKRNHFMYLLAHDMWNSSSFVIIVRFHIHNQSVNSVVHYYYILLYTILLYKVHITDHGFLDDLPTQPIIRKVDDPPSFDEVEKTILSLNDIKTAGPDNIPAWQHSDNIRSTDGVLLKNKELTLAFWVIYRHSQSSQNYATHHP